MIYDLPFGKGKRFGSSWNGGINAVLGNWEVDVIQKITSGFPVFILDSNNQSGSSFAFPNPNRPDQTCAASSSAYADLQARTAYTCSVTAWAGR